MRLAVTWRFGWIRQTFQLGDWQEFGEGHPEHFKWGFDREGTSVSYYDPWVSRRAVLYAGASIGGLDPSVREGYSNKNAARIMGGSGSVRN